MSHSVTIIFQILSNENVLKEFVKFAPGPSSVPWLPPSQLIDVYQSRHLP